MAPHGTAPLERSAVSPAGPSGIRLRNIRLTAPMAPLKAKSAANCQGRGLAPRHNAEMRKLKQLAEFTRAASRDRYRPRTSAGTSEEIHGNQAQLEMPRDRLNPKSSARTKASREPSLRKMPVSGTNAMAKMNSTRVPQPAKTNRL